VITAVWGITLLAEAGARVLIVEMFPAGDALLVVKLMPYLVLGGLLRWMAAYTRRLRQQTGQIRLAGQAESAAGTGHSGFAAGQLADSDPAPVLARR
jgi:hypothetical protein